MNDSGEFGKNGTIADQFASSCGTAVLGISIPRGQAFTTASFLTAFGCVCSDLFFFSIASIHVSRRHLENEAIHNCIPGAIPAETLFFGGELETKSVVRRGCMHERIPRRSKPERQHPDC